jgi:hypothetical protein
MPTMAQKPKDKPVSPGGALVALRYAKQSPEERSAAAKNAAEKRWAATKKKATKKKAQK